MQHAPAAKKGTSTSVRPVWTVLERLMTTDTACASLNFTLRVIPACLALTKTATIVTLLIAVRVVSTTFTWTGLAANLALI